MTGAACAARVQAKLNKLDGVAASVNLSTERAWVPAPPDLSARDLVNVVEAAGYTAEVATPPGHDGDADATAADEATVRRLRRRLTLALVFFVPLTDASLMMSVFPWTRFPGWQWRLVGLAVPVATWAAWPFHAAALRQARHLSSVFVVWNSLRLRRFTPRPVTEIPAPRRARASSSLRPWRGASSRARPPR